MRTPSYQAEEPEPVEKPPPWIQNITGRLAPSSAGVHTLRTRQSSDWAPVGALTMSGGGGLGWGGGRGAALGGRPGSVGGAPLRSRRTVGDGFLHACPRLGRLGSAEAVLAAGGGAVRYALEDLDVALDQALDLAGGRFGHGRTGGRCGSYGGRRLGRACNEAGGDAGEQH